MGKNTLRRSHKFRLPGKPVPKRRSGKKGPGNATGTTDTDAAAAAKDPPPPSRLPVQRSLDFPLSHPAVSPVSLGRGP